MIVKVRLFAAAKDIAGSASLQVELPDHANVTDLQTQLLRQQPALKDILAHCLFAIDHEYVSADTLLSANMDVACIPPVSGG